MDFTAEQMNGAVVDTIFGVGGNLEGDRSRAGPVDSADTGGSYAAEVDGDGKGMINACGTRERVGFASHQGYRWAVVHAVDNIGELVVGSGDSEIRGFQAAQA